MSQPSPLATPMPWDLVAPAYTAEVAPAFEVYARDAIALATAPEGSRIVDIACGPGTLSLLAARAGHAVDALDFSPAMIERLDARVAAEKLPITSHLGDGQALPYDAKTFSAGFSMFGLMFFPDRAKGWAELRRVLVPGARAVVSSWTRLEDTPALAAMFGAIRRSLKVLMGDGAPQPGSQEMPLSTEDLCRAEMSAAFSRVEVHRIAHVQTHASADEFWASVERTMAPMLLLRKSLGEDKWRGVSDAARTAIGGALGPGEARVTMTALLSVGTA